MSCWVSLANKATPLPAAVRRPISHERMQRIGDSDRFQQVEQNMKLNTADPIARYGFTQLPNFILRNPDLSANAKTVYSLLLSYAWHNNLAFPARNVSPNTWA